MDPLEIGKEIKRIREKLYDLGYWAEADTEIRNLLENIENDSPEFYSAICLRGWVLFKMSRREEARINWLNVVSISNSTVKDRISASCGLAIIYSSDGKIDITLNLVDNIKIMLENNKISEPTVAIYLNSLGIALAKIGNLKKAEETLRQAMLINEDLELDFRSSQHQRAKNGYNLVSLILIPSGRINEAEVELKDEVIPRYREVGALTDLAAACYRLSQIYLGQGNYREALDSEIISTRIWYEHKEDDPQRFENSKNNLKKIFVQMGLNWEDELQKVLRENDLL